MLLLFAAMQAGTLPIEPRPTPINAGSWIATDDYPADALVLHQEGEVGFDISVNSTGAVTDCTITASSGVKLLDDKTCQLIKLRGHFSPASRPDGTPIGSHFRNRIIWTLPRGSSSDETMMLVTIASGADGFRCSVAYAAADVPWTDPRCQMIGGALVREGLNFPNTLMEYFKPSSATASGPKTNWVMNDDYPAEALRNHWVGKSVFLLDLDASGHVTKCTITSSAGHKVLDDETCRLMTTRAKFSPAKGADGVATSSHYASSMNWQIPDR